MNQELKITNPPNDLDIIKVAQILSVKLGSATGSDTKWEEFGMRLLQTTSRDDVWLIDPDRSLFLRDKYKGLLNHWKSGKQDPKWDDVIKVLKEMKLVGLATALQKALGTTDHDNTKQLSSGEEQVTGTIKTPQEDKKGNDQEQDKSVMEKDKTQGAYIQISADSTFTRGLASHTVAIWMGKFAKVFNEIRKIFEKQKLDVFSLISNLCILDAKKITIFSTDKVFKEVQSVSELFIHIARCCNVFDYELLEAFLESTECTEAKNLLDSFTKELMSSAMNKLDLLSIGEEFKAMKPGSHKLTVKYMGEQCTQNIEKIIRKAVFEYFGLIKGSIILVGVETGCLRILYEISSAVKSYFQQYPKTDEDFMQFFKTYKIECLFIDGEELKAISEPLYTVGDLKKKMDENFKAAKEVLHYNKLNPQQQDIVAKVQAMIIVVNEKEFMATMCYLKPPESQNSILKIQFKTVIGPDDDTRIFYFGKFGKCPVAVTQVEQGHGEDAVHHARKEYFKDLVLFAAVGILAGFPGKVKLGDVLISDKIHDCSHYKDQNGVYIPRGGISKASKFMLGLLKDHYKWQYPCTKDRKRNASVESGLILSKSVLLDNADERNRLLQYFGPEAKGFEMKGFGIMNSSVGFIVIKGVCDFAGEKTKEWQPTAALAANDYLHHHFCQTDLRLLLKDNTKQSSSPVVSSEEQVTGTSKKPPEGEVNRKDKEQAKGVVEEDKTQGEYNVRQLTRGEGSHDLPKGDESHDPPTAEGSHDLPKQRNGSDGHQQAGCNDHIIDQYITAIKEHKDQLFDGQKLLAYKVYLIEAGAVSSKEFNDIKKQYSRNRPRMEAIVELLISKRDLHCLIGLSAVWYRYAEDDAEELFPFISELGDLHPKKGQLTIKTKSSSKHLTTNTTTTIPPPPTAAAAADDPSSYNPAPLAIPTQLLTATNCKYKLLWLVDDIHVVQRVLSDLKQPSLSPACHTDRIAYWETVLFNEVQLCLICPEAADKVGQSCVHMMERFKPNMALLTGVCTTSKRNMKLCTIDDRTVRLGDVIVSQTAVKISSGADVKEKRYRAQTKQVSSRLISDLRVESRKWERDGGLWLQHYKSDIPLRPMSYQRLWYTRLYLELELTSEERTGWLELNKWQTAEKSNSVNNKKIMEQEMPKLLDTFKKGQIDKRYWDRSDSKMLPVKPIHTELLGYCKNSIEYKDMEFPTKHLENISVHFASMLTTDSNPTGEDIDRCNAISNTVKAADLDTFSFYDNTESCNLFLSIKGVFLMDDGMLDQSDSDYKQYAQLTSTSYALQAIKHLYHKIIIE